jgi:ribosomal protein S18 acetylase RimI-like enzyme
MPVRTPPLYLRRAITEDVDTLLRWRVETAEYLATRHHTDQWSKPYPRERLERWANRGVMWMASLDRHVNALPIATVTLDDEPEPGLWTAEEQKTAARYLSKLNVKPTDELRGLGIGAALVDWCFAQTVKAGGKYVRIDCWSTNTSLHSYYEQFGFKYVRTVPDVNSGALFQAEAKVPQTPLRIHVIDMEQG